MDFVLSKWIAFSALIVIIGFSKKPINREPMNAPIMAPKMIESRLEPEISSAVFFRNFT